MRLILILLGLVLSALGCRTQPKVVATVNGIKLTEADLEREMRQTRAFYLARFDIDISAPENSALLAEAQAEALERIIRQELMHQVAAGAFPTPTAGMSPLVLKVSDEEVQARAQQYESQAGSREELLEQNGFLSYQEFLDYVRGELEVEKIFQVYGLAEQVHARHILVKTEAEAKQVLARLRAGEDFAKVAQEVSTDTGSSAQGGDLGWVGRGVMVAPFELAAFSLGVGELSEPVRSQFGFHIIQVLEKGTRPDESAFQAWYEGLAAQADIERMEP